VGIIYIFRLPCTCWSITKYVYDTHGDDVYKLTEQNGKVWFDDYDGEGVLLIDDFYGWIPYNVMLSITEGYQLRLEVKGTFTYAKWTKIYITSNVAPPFWYPLIKDTTALFARFKEIKKVIKENAVQKDIPEEE